VSTRHAPQHLLGDLLANGRELLGTVVCCGQPRAQAGPGPLCVPRLLLRQLRTVVGGKGLPSVEAAMDYRHDIGGHGGLLRQHGLKAVHVRRAGWRERMPSTRTEDDGARGVGSRAQGGDGCKANTLVALSLLGGYHGDGVVAQDAAASLQ
jgi:hypothetical protein